MGLKELGFSLAAVLSGDSVDSPRRFSGALEKFSGFANVIPVSSGRAGFRLLLEILEFEPGSEIIFPAYTFHPMPVVAAEYGLKPVFADVDPRTWNIDPEKIAPLITKQTKAIVPTHLFGVPADMDAIGKIAHPHGLFVIEDCAHSLGARYLDRPVGNLGDAALFTFAMSKNLPCWGGGAMVLKDPELATRMRERIETQRTPSAFSVLNRQRSNIIALILTQPWIFPWTLYLLLRMAGARGSNYFDRPFLEEVRGIGNQLSVISPEKHRRDGASGSQLHFDSQYAGDRKFESHTTDHGSGITGLADNCKSLITGLSPFQASVGLRQLARFPRWLEKQVRNARLLRDRLKNCRGFQLQQEPSGARSSFLYVRARVDNPGKVRQTLLLKGVDTKPDDMRNCAGLKIFGDQMLCRYAARLGGHCIEIPCSHFYSERQIMRLADRILSVASRF